MWAVGGVGSGCWCWQWLLVLVVVSSVDDVVGIIEFQ
jgi:hypothetical protein